MKPFDIAVRPFEVVAGRDFPRSVAQEPYGRDLEQEKARFEEKLSFFGDVMRLEGIKSSLGWIAGKEYPDVERIRGDISSGCDGPIEVDNIVHNHKTEFRKSLVRLEGLRQALQRRRDN